VIRIPRIGRTIRPYYVAQLLVRKRSLKIMLRLHRIISSQSLGLGLNVVRTEKRHCGGALGLPIGFLLQIQHMSFTASYV
jgi:hypothetical protein